MTRHEVIRRAQQRLDNIAGQSEVKELAVMFMRKLVDYEVSFSLDEELGLILHNKKLENSIF